MKDAARASCGPNILGEGTRAPDAVLLAWEVGGDKAARLSERGAVFGPPALLCSRTAPQWSLAWPGRWGWQSGGWRWRISGGHGASGSLAGSTTGTHPIAAAALTLGARIGL